MTHDREIAGSIAFSRRSNPNTEEYDTASSSRRLSPMLVDSEAARSQALAIAGWIANSDLRLREPRH